MHNTIHINESFNRNVLRIICLAGLLRVIAEMLINEPVFESLDFFLDMGYGIVFLCTLIALFTNGSYTFIYFSFYLPFTALLCLTLLDNSGIAGSVENNIHIGLMIIALTVPSRDAWKISIYLMIGTFLILVVVEQQHHFLERYTGYSTSHFNYLFMALGAILISSYTKWTYEKSRNELSQAEKKLLENRNLLESSQVRLESQTKELQALNLQLEQKVHDRAIRLKQQRAAMKAYLNVTLKELQGEYEDVQKLATDVFQKPDDELSHMMLRSAQELDREINMLVSKLKDQQ